MRTTDFQMKLSDKEFGILNDLYNYRVMTTEQIKKLHFNNQGTYVNKVLWKMRNKKLIKTDILRNSRKGKKGYSYHRLTETGLECLVKHGKGVEEQLSLYARPKQVSYLLLISELVSDLIGTKWEIWDSRKVKREYNLDKRMNIQGLAISTEQKRYGLYVLTESSSVKTIGKIQSEIRTNAHNLLHDYLILAKGKNSFVDFADRAIEPQTEGENRKSEPLYTGHSVKIYPYIPFILKTKSFQTEKDWLMNLCNYYGFKIKSIKKKEGRQSFPIIIEYKGKEWYLVDLTDSDLNKYRDIEVYSRSNSSRRWEKREIIAVTLGLPTKMNYKLSQLPAVKQFVLSSNEFIRICK